MQRNLLDALEQIAKAANFALAGRWAYAPHGDTGDYGVGVAFDEITGKTLTGRIDCDDYQVSEPVAVEVKSQPYAAHIATFDPPTVLALIAAARAQSPVSRPTGEEVAGLGECLERLSDLEPEDVVFICGELGEVSRLDPFPISVGALRSLSAERDAMEGALGEITAERLRQITVEGWTPEHDDEHGSGEMALAASCYAFRAARQHSGPTMYWPWDRKWWKPGPPRRMLIKAAALIVAEIERLDRAALQQGGEA